MARIHRSPRSESIEGERTDSQGSASTAGADARRGSCRSWWRGDERQKGLIDAVYGCMR